MDAVQRAEIITLARKTIVQFGVKSLRMDEIARSAHVSKRTLYETFGDKEELIFLAVREHFEIFELGNMKSAKNAPNILIAILIVMEEIRKNSDVNWRIRSSLRQFYPEVNERLWNDNADEKRKVVISSIQMGIKQGYIDSRINIDLTLNMFTYIAIGISESNDMLKIPKEISMNDAFREVLINYIRGISTVKGVQIIDEYLAKIEE
ncbi:MAG: TetR/AcrR family transcriptional regulator [Rikenellaceae bacterium]